MLNFNVKLTVTNSSVSVQIYVVQLQTQIQTVKTVMLELPGKTWDLS